MRIRNDLSKILEKAKELVGKMKESKEKKKNKKDERNKRNKNNNE